MMIRRGSIHLGICCVYQVRANNQTQMRHYRGEKQGIVQRNARVQEANVISLTAVAGDDKDFSLASHRRTVTVPSVREGSAS